ncbi:BTAD domain-containing putative transcriptional regulator [Streptomyces sp. NPDC059009]|uniref:AfsR/SARP family transcriptional regulator n=1 Tax=Streptomyces sp. NPDC059009 TaxID=3346694 RepID=UPI00368EEEB6
MGVLGSLMLAEGGENFIPSAPKPRQLLGFLMLNANRVVRATDCITELWGTQPPKSAMSTLQTHVLNIRQTLRTPRVDLSDTLITRNQGYQLQVREQDFDRCRFMCLAKRGREAAADGRTALASQLFSDALALWRGPVLADVHTGPMSSPHLVELEETRKGVLEQRIEADLALGRHHDLLDELSTLAALHPTHENVHAQLMVALYRCGEPARASAVFQRLRRTLGESLGIAPAPRMQRLHQAVLSGSPLLDAPALRA